mmetsp:Transcript_48/g.233  ORF Transcript_48/g.233 Transcript_48/m.233 type:complete len:251 (-) Transcript_48:835-1587(-)
MRHRHPQLASICVNRCSLRARLPFLLSPPPRFPPRRLRILLGRLLVFQSSVAIQLDFRILRSREGLVLHRVPPCVTRGPSCAPWRWPGRRQLRGRLLLQLPLLPRASLVIRSGVALIAHEPSVRGKNVCVCNLLADGRRYGRVRQRTPVQRSFRRIRGRRLRFCAAGGVRLNFAPELMQKVERGLEERPLPLHHRSHKLRVKGAIRRCLQVLRDPHGKAIAQHSQQPLPSPLTSHPQRRDVVQADLGIVL